MLGICTDRVGVGIAWEVFRHLWVAHMQHGKIMFRTVVRIRGDAGVHLII